MNGTPHEPDQEADFVYPGSPVDLDPTGAPVYLEPRIPEVVTPDQLPNDLLYNHDSFDTRIFDATNRLRTDPQSFISYLEETIAKFDQFNNRLTYEMNGETFVWWTHEGKAAF